MSLTVSEVEHLFIHGFLCYPFGECPVVSVVHSSLGLLDFSSCACRSSVPADQWQAATLGKAAGESTGRMGDLVTGREGAHQLLPLPEVLFSSHVSFPWRTPSSAPCLLLSWPLEVGQGAQQIV